MNETLDLLINRASIRSYIQEPIKDADKELIEEAIYRSPTAGNMQDFSVIAIDNQKLKTGLSVLCDNQLFIAKAPLIYVFVSDFSRYKDYFEIHNVDDSKFKVPHLGTMLNGIIDSTIAAQTASIAANILGIGTCYIGDIVENKEQVMDLLGLNDNMIPVAMLTLGYYEQQIKQSPKIDKKYIIHKNKYCRATKDQLEVMFKSKTVPKKYQSEYKNFASYYYDTKVGADFSKEMDRSIRLYINNFDKTNG